jgi:hypothetical protein
MPLSCSERPPRGQRDRYSPTLFTSTPHCARTGLAFQANRTSEKFLTAVRPRATGRFRQRASRSRRHSSCTATARRFDSGHGRRQRTPRRCASSVALWPSDDDGVVREPASTRGEPLDLSDARSPIVGEQPAPLCRLPYSGAGGRFAQHGSRMPRVRPGNDPVVMRPNPNATRVWSQRQCLAGRTARDSRAPILAHADTVRAAIRARRRARPSVVARRTLPAGLPKRRHGTHVALSAPRTGRARPSGSTT